MEKNEIIHNMPKILAQVKKIAEKREYGMGIARAYYAGGTLCIDIYEYGLLKYLLMVNISGESFVINEVHVDCEFKTRLLDTESLKLAFEIYKMSKGKKEYYNECMQKSCLRHLA